MEANKFGILILGFSGLNVFLYSETEHEKIYKGLRNTTTDHHIQERYKQMTYWSVRQKYCNEDVSEAYMKHSKTVSDQKKRLWNCGDGFHI